jgi:hypothetical protein
MARLCRQFAKGAPGCALPVTVFQSAAPDDHRYVIQQADFRTFSWPEQLDCVFTDPPWRALDSYR